MSHAIQLRFDGRPGDFFSWAEFEVTSTGLPNVAPERARTCIQILVQHVLDPVRRLLGRPVRVTSGYRSDAVNDAVGGSETSSHKTGEAADIKVAGMTAAQVVAAILRSGVDFDQVIAYSPSRGGHVHIGIKAGAAARHRKQVLWAPASGGYEPYK
jgi:hypothetical protein